MSGKMKSEKLRRVVMTVAGVTASGVAVGFFNYSAFGMDPFQVLAHGLWNLTPIGYGTFYTVFSLFLFVFTLLMDRKKIGLGTIINMFLWDISQNFFPGSSPYCFPTADFSSALLCCLSALPLCAWGLLYILQPNMGVSVYDAVALCLSERTPIKFQYCRIGSDVICVAVGFFLGAQVGLGTVITMFFTGPLIHVFQQILAIPLIRGRNPVAYGIRKLYLTCKKALKQRRRAKAL